MSAFRDAIHDIISMPRTKPRLRAVPAIDAAAGRIQAPSADLEAQIEDKDYDRIASELKGKLERAAVLDWRGLRDAAWCLWGTNPRLAEYPVLLRGILREIAEQKSRKPYRSLATNYIRSFDLKLPGLPEIAQSLSHGAELRGMPWSGLQSDFSVFDPEVGPGRVAKAAISSDTSPTDVLKASGLNALEAQSGFAKHSTQLALELLAGGLQMDHARRLDLIRRLTLDERGRLIFSDFGYLVASALVLPFRDRTPETGLRDKILALLISLFGDPRLRSDGWIRMREAEQIVRRWLTEQSLRQFLDVVDKVAVERMWRYRRAFWEAVYGEKLVSEAWVVFGSDGEKVARRVFGKEASFGTFSRFGNKIVEKGHAVLLLRIGNGVVADWSHNGRCCIWSNHEGRGAPSLYQAVYSTNEVSIAGGISDDINRATFSISHMSPETYNWQMKVAAKIQQMTGHRVPQSKFVVRQ